MQVSERTTVLRTERLPSRGADFADFLFPEDDVLKTYALIDGARIENLPAKLHGFAPLVHACLFRGRIEPDIAAVAPYLVAADRAHPFTTWFLDQHWEESAGLFLLSGGEFFDVYKHLRRFLMVQDEAGKEFYFRYYDPRVLRVYLPTCNEPELNTFFGPVEEYILPDADPAFALSFSR